MACNKIMEPDGEVCKLRRSQRSKRERAEWHEEIIMSVRRSRAEGTGDLLECASVGGQPSHKKKKAKAQHNNDKRTVL